MALGERNRTMTQLISTLAIVVSILAIFVNQWVTFVPRLGIGFQYRRRRVQVIVAVVTITAALLLYWNNPTTGQLLVLLGVLLLTPLSGFNHASRTLVAVDQPEHVAASASGWPKDALVLGHSEADEESAIAWLLDTLIPHHLVNDTVNEKPMLAAW